MYEVEGDDVIVRMLTSLPEVGKVSIYGKPPVKKLFAPERCEVVSKEEFETLWQEGESQRG